jgi:hypothetical protein
MTNVLALQVLPGDFEDEQYLNAGRSTSGITSTCSLSWLCGG